MSQPDYAADRHALAVITDRLSDPRVADFFAHNAHRKAATRALLDLLGVPLPSWAQRNAGGRAAVTKAAMTRFRQDNPDLNLPRGYVPPKER
ncbi:hypothetical protein [Qipengyuania qiaonensis]|uniref:Uncharacterized protein n=1 Tax=Qipengyuania qiaonensis TaxID=2867240 RepID=A0ABS7J6L4_9SPHN|nr:hypothetical protein [Qipengyuania qiaonensis]MBX7482964.1 hypothetical protein [Qipengyuania qiaonensis]